MYVSIVQKQRYLCLSLHEILRSVIAVNFKDFDGNLPPVISVTSKICSRVRTLKRLYSVSHNPFHTSAKPPSALANCPSRVIWPVRFATITCGKAASAARRKCFPSPIQLPFTTACMEAEYSSPISADWDDLERLVSVLNMKGKRKNTRRPWHIYGFPPLFLAQRTAGRPRCSARGLGGAALGERDWRTRLREEAVG